MNQHLDSILEDSHTRRGLENVHERGKELKGLCLLLEIADALLPVEYFRSRSLRLVFGVQIGALEGLL